MAVEQIIFLSERLSNRTCCCMVTPVPAVYPIPSHPQHEPLKNGHLCKTLTSVSTMSMSTMSVFTMLMSTMSNGHCPCPPWVGEVAWLRGEEKDGTEECYHGDGRTNKQVNIEQLSQWTL